MSDRATVRIVGEPAGGTAGAPTGAHHQQGGGLPPDEQPTTAMPIVPPQEEEPTIGGNAFEAPRPEQIAQASGGSIADQMRARFEAIAATEEFGVPGWELPDGSPGLIIEARTFGDRKAFVEGVSNEAYIAKSTHRLLFVDDQGRRQVIEGGWGPRLAEMMGVQVSKAADLVSIVISKPDPANPGQRIPNVAGIGALATKIVQWAQTGTRQAEEDLGG